MLVLHTPVIRLPDALELHAPDPFPNPVVEISELSQCSREGRMEIVYRPANHSI